MQGHTLTPEEPAIALHSVPNGHDEIGLSSKPSSTRQASVSSTKPALNASETPKFKQRFLYAAKQRDTWKFIACCLQAATGGWNDACAGGQALIPYIEDYFHLSFVEVSTLFIGAFAGFCIACVLNALLMDKLGRGRVVVLGAICQMLGFSVLVAPPPWALYPLTYALLIGFGIALQMASTSSYIASLPDASIRLNYTQAAYGLGALLSPLAATAMVTSGIRFSYFFSVSLGLALINSVVMFLTFWRDERERPDYIDRPAVTENESGIELQNTYSSHNSPVEEPLTTAEKNRAIFSNKNVWLSAVFLCFYVGAEVSIGGWSVSFLLRERDGTQNVGYVSSGFWAAITVGRLTLPRLQNRFGDRRCLYVYIALALVLEIVVWTWRSLVGNAVAICAIGFLLATFFGIAILNLIKLLPKSLHSAAIGLVAAAGQAGSAAFPFVVGSLSQKFGPVVLQPVVIILLCAMALVFAFIPNADRRKE